MKKLIMVLTIACSIVSVKYSNARPISEQQAQKYITHVMESLFIPALLQSKNSKREIAILTKHVTKELLKIQGVYDKTGIKKYSALDLCENLIKIILDTIEAKTKEYASKELLLLSIPESISKDKLINSLGSTLREKAELSINTTKPLQSGALTNYIGFALRNKVTKLLKEAIAQRAKQIT